MRPYADSTLRDLLLQDTLEAWRAIDVDALAVKRIVSQLPFRIPCDAAVYCDRDIVDWDNSLTRMPQVKEQVDWNTVVDPGDRLEFLDVTRSALVAPPEQRPYLFLREGNIWTLRFTAGSNVERGKFKDRRGFAEYAKLLANPGKRIDSLELVTLATVPLVSRPSRKKSVVDAPLSVGMTHQEVADKKYIADVMKEKKSLEERAEVARSVYDDATADGLNYETEKLQKQLDQLMHAGRRKEFASGENPQLAHRALKLGFHRLRSSFANHGMPRFALYLKQTVKTQGGWAWCYMPAEPIEWVLGNG
jgi:hypothetical protein